jgi:hypothetical protein
MGNVQGKVGGQSVISIVDRVIVDLPDGEFDSIATDRQSPDRQ